jgi:hypothetical protein
LQTNWGTGSLVQFSLVFLFNSKILNFPCN